MPIYAIYNPNNTGITGVIETEWRVLQPFTQQANVKFKKVKTFDEGVAQLNEFKGVVATTNVTPVAQTTNNPSLENEYLTCDGSASGTQNMQFRVTHTKDNNTSIVFTSDVYPKGTNNIAELLGIAYAVHYARHHQLTCPIYSDSVSGMKWAKDGQLNTSMDLEEAGLQQVVQSALNVLQTPYPNQIKKWDTASLGEIPSDFNRK